MADVSMPTAIVQWMRQRGWGDHHLQWHVVRSWDRLSPAAVTWATGQGWSRYPIQEGEERNGLQFLAMHRVMIQRLVTAFPTHAALFAGWTTPPSDPNDALDPVPGAAPGPLPPEMIGAIARLETALEAFDGEDELGRFIETAWRPFPSNPRRRSDDASSGLHNVMHNRFADENSSIDLGNPEVNIENERFWRLHGWIDARWSAYRAATGRSDTDPAYLAALADEASHMPGDPVHHGPMPSGFQVRREIPAVVRSSILRTLSGRD